MTISTPKLSEEEKKERRRKSARECAQRNRDGVNAKRRQSYKDDPTKRRSENKKSYDKDLEKSRKRGVRNRFKNKYGISVEHRDALFKAQGFVCAICASPSPNTKSGWHTDHDHQTGRVRGVLCHHCNLLLGNARDNPLILASAARYLN
jgi:hypothetical protein